MTAAPTTRKLLDAFEALAGALDVLHICADMRGLVRHGLGYWRLKNRYLRWQAAKGA